MMLEFHASFIPSDLRIVGRAASVAENLTAQYFDLTSDEWKRNPYGLLTRKHVHRHLHEPDAFASVVKVVSRDRPKKNRVPDGRFGIVLQDPNILRALLRSRDYDLWTLMLFVLTHELVHIVRFRRFNVDFFAEVSERDKEEKVVHGITKEILQSAPNTLHLLSLYEDSDVKDPERATRTVIERRS